MTNTRLHGTMLGRRNYFASISVKLMVLRHQTVTNGEMGGDEQWHCDQQQLNSRKVQLAGLSPHAGLYSVPPTVSDRTKG
jgi:hypothetical protein